VTAASVCLLTRLLTAHVGQTDSQTKSQWQSLTPSFGGAKLLSKQIMVREFNNRHATANNKLIPSGHETERQIILSLYWKHATNILQQSAMNLATCLQETTPRAIEGRLHGRTTKSDNCVDYASVSIKKRAARAANFRESSGHWMNVSQRQHVSHSQQAPYIRRILTACGCISQQQQQQGWSFISRHKTKMQTVLFKRHRNNWSNEHRRSYRRML